MKGILECCVDSVESAIAAKNGGADRLELCQGLVIGGVTPGTALFQEIKNQMDIRIHALMRPRFGDFCYTRHEIDILCEDIRTFRKLGADAAVIGALKPDGTLDVEAMKRMIDAAGDMSITLHRAFDVCRDPFEALETAKELGVNTILTSGQRKSAKEGVEILKQLALKADGKVDIMAGAGIDADAIRYLAPKTGITTFHMSGKMTLDSRMVYRKEGINMGLPSMSEFEIWRTDEKVQDFYAIHGRPQAYKELNPGDVAYYDGMIEIDLSQIRPMIAMPFHPSNTYTIEELNANLMDILDDCEKRAEVSFDGAVKLDLKSKVRNGKLYVDQGIIAGCAGGGFENICDAADILKGASIGPDEFTLSVYPASTPIYMELVKNGAVASLMETGAIVKTAFCGPCFGAGDTPANNAFSIRHSTRNFPNREGSKVQKGQVASVALMDARSIAATAANKGYLTAATDLDVNYTKPKYFFDKKIYENRVFDSKGVADPGVEIQFGPNIKDWPAMSALPEHMVLKVVSEIHDPVTTTDELIPSGETSSFRSNPLGLAEFALSRKDPLYVGRAKEIQKAEKAVEAGECPVEAVPELQAVIDTIKTVYPDFGEKARKEKGYAGFGSTIFAVKPGDGSAREQAASCQKVLGGWANIANEYATKRYRSNLINWGMLPFIIGKGDLPFENLDYLFIPEIRKAVEDKQSEIQAYAVKDGALKPFSLHMDALTDDEREIILKGCLINYYRG